MLKPCHHVHRCVHPCDADECFLETIEQPNGPVVALTKKQCDAFEKMIEDHFRSQQ
jgi:hypothetical protein